ncbi:MAG: hypothetical protein GX489_03450 [Firmicutes bacterium]|nr:hypothetical protein [Bacillota bacterium]
MPEAVGGAALAMPQLVSNVSKNKDQTGLDADINAFAALLAGMLTGTGLQALPVLPDVRSDGSKAALALPDVSPAGGNWGLLLTDIKSSCEEQAVSLAAETTEEQLFLSPAEVTNVVSAEEIAPRLIAATTIEGETKNGDLEPELVCQDETIVSQEITGENVVPTVSKEDSDKQTFVKKETESELTQLTSALIKSKEQQITPEENRLQLGLSQEPLTSKTKATANTPDTILAAPSSTGTQLVTREDINYEEPHLSVREAARLFGQVLEQASRQKGSGQQEVMLKLDPPNLGRVHLTLLYRAGAVSARFEVENDAARGALQANMTELKNTLVEQGIRVEDFSVFIGQGGTGSNQFAGRQDDKLPSQPRVFPAVHTISSVAKGEANGRRPVQSALDLLV